MVDYLCLHYNIWNYLKLWNVENLTMSLNFIPNRYKKIEYHIKKILYCFYILS